MARYSRDGIRSGLLSGFRAGLILCLLTLGAASYGQEWKEGEAGPLAGAPAPVVYQEPSLISLDFKEAEIQTVLQALAR